MGNKVELLLVISKPLKCLVYCFYKKNDLHVYKMKRPSSYPKDIHTALPSSLPFKNKEKKLTIVVGTPQPRWSLFIYSFQISIFIHLKFDF